MIFSTCPHLKVAFTQLEVSNHYLKVSFLMYFWMKIQPSLFFDVAMNCFSNQIQPKSMIKYLLCLNLKYYFGVRFDLLVLISFPKH